MGPLTLIAALSALGSLARAEDTPTPPGAHAALPPGCGAQFEFLDPTLGWTRFVYGTSLPSPAIGLDVDPRAFLPPHDQAPTPPPPTWCGSVLPWEPPFEITEDARRTLFPRPDWRIVDGDGQVLVAFDGPYATDARPLAALLGTLDDYEQGKADPACQARDGHECWTAFELWVALEDWSDARCRVLDEQAPRGGD